MHIRHFILFFATIVAGAVFGQEKSEKEYKARPGDIPQQALEYVDSFHFPDKIKWYVEEGLNDTTVEAKTGTGEDRYSIEFFTDGTLQDVEIDRLWESLPEATRSNMETQLGSDFASFKIGQVQVQYSGDPGLIRDYILTGIAGDQIQTLYELVIDGTLGGQRNQWEYTFTASGAFTKREKIIGRSTDNLEF